MALLQRGDQVIALTRDPAVAKAIDPDIDWRAWEAMEPPPPGALDGVDAVINFQGERILQPWTEAAMKRILESRRTGTRNLVAAVAAMPSKPKVFINGSALGYYGYHEADFVDEADGPPAEPPFESQVAQAWEEAAALPLPEVTGPLGTGDQYLSWIHVDDEADLILRALDDDSVDGVLNGTSPNSVTNREFAEATGAALMKPVSGPVPAEVIEAEMSVHEK